MRGENKGTVKTVRTANGLRDGAVINIEGKNITLTPSEVKSIESLPTMQQFDKFKSIVSAKAPGTTEKQLADAMRNALIETNTGFDLQTGSVGNVSTTGTTPVWNRSRTEG